jgi:TRAP-type uncharacterized transport system fused permease subunit
MYFVPFFFVLNPALILRGAPAEILIVVATAVAGITLIAAALEGYLVGFGTLRFGPTGALSRVLLMSAGVAMALPGGGKLGVGHWELTLLGIGLALAGAFLAWAGKRASIRDA